MPTTRERVIALVKSSPHLNQSEIAERLGVTRQRVAQIVASEELNVPKGKRGVAPRAKPAPAADAARDQVRETSIPEYLARAGGPVSVLLTAADLMTRGFTVYLPIAPTAAADLVAIDRDGAVKRIGVAPPKRDTSTPYTYPTPEEIDTRAFVLTDEPVRYEPALEKTRKR